MDQPTEDKKPWVRLSAAEQMKYEAQADYLLERNYVLDISRAKLAQKIYENS